MVNIIACNSTRKSTCKSRAETAALLSRGLIRVYVMRNVVDEDQFSNNKAESKSRYKGDASDYFPIQYQLDYILVEPVITTNWTNYNTEAIVFKQIMNDLSIDDSMFLDRTRSTKFFNTEERMRGWTSNGDWPGIFEGEDRIYYFRFEVSSVTRALTRTRRKFWTDVSLRGG